MSDPLGLINTSSINRPIQPVRTSGASAPDENLPSFKQVLMNNLEQVNRLQQEAQHAVEDLASGKRDDVAGVMMAKQKADLAFQMLLQVRNKMVAAYEEVKQMRV
ncbi:MAG: flagellar hook-basal body complex protein FliE [Phycisphaerales bacterium]|nr:flagellar hook-basal body complex protein FliE [Phycisphaerales bacterium]